MSERVFFKYQIWERGGRAVVTESTNDNLDKGYPTEYACWETTWPTLEAALKHTGKSRTGCLGAEVLVYLNGEKI
jgi:hypothetical protein